MKKLTIFLLFCGALLISSCSDDAAPTGSGGFGGPGGGGGGTGNVTYTVAVVQDQQQQYFFEFKPSTGATVESITGNCAAAGVNNETVQGDGTTVYSSTSPAYIGPVTNLAQGQQWTFVIKGKVGSSTGAAYTANASLNL